jgi:hypothetical protein
MKEHGFTDEDIRKNDRDMLLMLVATAAVFGITFIFDYIVRNEFSAWLVMGVGMASLLASMLRLLPAYMILLGVGVFASGFIGLAIL